MPAARSCAVLLERIWVGMVEETLLHGTPPCMQAIKTWLGMSSWGLQTDPEKTQCGCAVSSSCKGRQTRSQQPLQATASLHAACAFKWITVQSSKHTREETRVLLKQNQQPQGITIDSTFDTAS